MPINEFIVEVRGQLVILDEILARLYEVETKVLNQSVKRHKDRFPEDFMFQLSKEEWSILRSQIVTSRWGGRRYPPMAFTEQGVAMLSSVLQSQKAINMNISIIRAFIYMRRMAVSNDLPGHSIALKMLQLASRLDEHDLQLKAIYETIEDLLDKQVNSKAWEDRNMIGFRSA